MSMSMEPKREFRWIVKIPGIDSFLLKTVTRPSFKLLHPGLKLDPLKIVMFDAVKPSGAQQIMKWVTEDFRRDMQICLLNEDGVIIEQWQICGARLDCVDFGQLDYGSEGLCTITMVIDYTDFKLDF